MDLGSKHVRIPSYKELFYLHPDYYQPNPDILEILGVKEDETYSIVRFVSWQAHHDIGQKGILDKKELVQTLEAYGRVFITSEAPLDTELEKYRIKIPIDRIHDALYYAQLFFSDSQTMTTEAAILGTPAIRCNTFVGKNDMTNFIELEQQYGLIYNFSEISPAIEKAKELLSSPNVNDEWAEKRRKLLAQKVDPNKIFMEMILNANK